MNGNIHYGRSYMREDLKILTLKSLTSVLKKKHSKLFNESNLKSLLKVLIIICSKASTMNN